MERSRAAVHERSLGAGNELFHGRRDEDLAHIGGLREARAHVDRHATELVVEALALTGVHAGPHLQPERRQVGADAAGRVDRVARQLERRDVTGGRTSCDDLRVVTELAILDVKPGEERAFEAAFGEAQAIIAGMPGFSSLDLQRCVERESRYLLLVEWQRLEDHTEGFRGSPEYADWRRLLHHFYDPFPTVEHYNIVTRLP